MSNLAKAFILCTIFAGTGCANDFDGLMDEGAGASGSEPEQVAQVTNELNASVVLGPYNWDNSYGSARPLKPASTHVCVLAKVSGKFMGNGERVRVYQSTYNNQTYWMLGDQAAQTVAATAYCFAWSAFTGPYPTSLWYSGDFTTSTFATGNQTCFLGICSTSIHAGYSSTNAWWGDATTIVQGMSGRFDGYGEYVRVTQVNDGSRSSLLEVGSASWDAAVAGQRTRVYGNSIFVGLPGTGSLAKYYGPLSSSPSTAGDVGEYSVTNSGQVLMAETSKAMCHFTYIAGKFRGLGERAEIKPVFDNAGKERWALQTTSGQNGIAARARCFAFSQF